MRKTFCAAMVGSVLLLVAAGARAEPLSAFFLEEKYGECVSECPAVQGVCDSACRCIIDFIGKKYSSDEYARISAAAENPQGADAETAAKLEVLSGVSTECLSQATE